MKIIDVVISWWNSLLIKVGFKKLSFREKLPKEAREHYDAIRTMLRSSFSSIPERVEENVSPLPEPLRSNLWIVEIGNIDCFMASSVVLPTIISTEKKGKISIDYSNMYISFYERLENPIANDLIKLLDSKAQKLKIKTVNHLGRVVEEWVLDVKPIKIHPSSLDYEDQTPFRWQLECECLKWKINLLNQTDEHSDVSSTG